LSGSSPVQYSPRRKSSWTLFGKDLWKRWVLSLEWNWMCDGEYAAEIWDRQGSWSGVTVHSDYDDGDDNRKWEIKVRLLLMTLRHQWQNIKLLGVLDINQSNWHMAKVCDAYGPNSTPFRCMVNRPPPVNCPPVRCPLFLPHRSIAPWIKRPRSNAPSCQTILPASGRMRESMYNVYHVVIVTGIGAIFLREKNTHTQRTTYGTGMSWAITIQSKVLIAVAIDDIREW